MGGISRRGFLGAAGGAAAGFTFGKLGLRHVLPSAADPAERTADHLGQPKSRWAVSVCGGCAAGCSVRLRLYQGRLVGIKGNPHCPLSGGGLCARGANEVEAYYDPDRIVGPIVRTGERGQDKWKRVKWGEALDQVASKLKASPGPRVGVVLSSPAGSNAAMIERVLAGLGSPHVYRVDHLRDEAALALAALGFGEARPYTYDLDRTDLILSFGSPILEGWLSPTYVAKRFGRGRRRKTDRLQLIHIGSRLSPTAMRADRWIRCEPGTEPIVALALATTLLHDGLIDEAAAARLPGFDDEKKRLGFRRILERVYTPYAASRKSGVSVVDLLAVARAFARAKAPVAIGERLAGSAGLYGLAAVHLINALTGRFGAPGGVLFTESAPVGALAGPTTPAAGRLDRPLVVPLAGAGIWRVLGDMQTKHREPPFDVLFVEDGAALSGVEPGSPAYDLLKKTPFVISLGRSLDASTDLADVVLPSASTFEQHLDVEAPHAGPFTALAVARPALPPLTDGRSPGEIFLALGRRVGGPAALKLRDAREAVETRLAGLHRARRGTPYTTPFGQSWLAEMERAGWWAPSAPSEVSFRTQVYAAGGWVDPYLSEDAAQPPAPYRVYQAATGEEAGLLALPEADLARAPRAERDDNPEAPTGETFALEPFVVGALNGTGTPNRPSLLQIAAPHIYGAYRPWAELNPEDLDRLGVEPGGQVKLTSTRGTLVLAAHRAVGVRPGTVAVPWAPAARGRGRYAKTWGEGADRLAAGHAGVLGACTAAGLRVRVERAKEGDA